MTMSSQDEGYRGGRAGDSDHHVTSRGSGPGAGRHSAHHHHGNNGKSRTKDSSTEPRDPQSEEGTSKQVHSSSHHRSRAQSTSSRSEDEPSSSKTRDASVETVDRGVGPTPAPPISHVDPRSLPHPYYLPSPFLDPRNGLEHASPYGTHPYGRYPFTNVDPGLLTNPYYLSAHFLDIRNGLKPAGSYSIPGFPYYHVPYPINAPLPLNAQTLEGRYNWPPPSGFHHPMTGLPTSPSHTDVSSLYGLRSPMAPSESVTALASRIHWEQLRQNYLSPVSGRRYSPGSIPGVPGFGSSVGPGYPGDYPTGFSPYGTRSMFTDVPPTPGSGSVTLPGSIENSSRQTSPRHSIIVKSRKRALSHSPISDYLDIQSLTRSSEGSLQLTPLLGATHSVSRSSSAASGSYGHLSAASLGALSPANQPQMPMSNPYFRPGANFPPPPWLHPGMQGMMGRIPHGASLMLPSTSQPHTMLQPPAQPQKPETPISTTAKEAGSSVVSSTVEAGYQDVKKTRIKSEKDLYHQHHSHSQYEGEEGSEGDEKPLSGDTQLAPGHIPQEGEPDFMETNCHWEDCAKEFDTQEELVKHINQDHIQANKKAFVCRWSECSREEKPFKAQYMLVVHMRRHTGEKPHRCTFEGCMKAYSRLENLKTHLRSHTGEKPYMCEFPGCTKAFSNASDRAKHQNRTHSNAKPYICKAPGCTKRYTDPSSLRKHVKTVHGPEFYANKKHKGDTPQSCKLEKREDSDQQGDDSRQEGTAKVEECMSVGSLQTSAGERRSSQDNVGSMIQQHPSPQSSPEVNVTNNLQSELDDHMTSGSQVISMTTQSIGVEEDADVPEPDEAEVPGSDNLVVMRQNRVNTTRNLQKRSLQKNVALLPPVGNNRVRKDGCGPVQTSLTDLKPPAAPNHNNKRIAELHNGNDSHNTNMFRTRRDSNTSTMSSYYSSLRSDNSPNPFGSLASSRRSSELSTNRLSITNSPYEYDITGNRPYHSRRSCNSDSSANMSHMEAQFQKTNLGSQPNLQSQSNSVNSSMCSPTSKYQQERIARFLAARQDVNSARNSAHSTPCRTPLPHEMPNRDARRASDPVRAMDPNLNGALKQLQRFHSLNMGKPLPVPQGRNLRHKSGSHNTFNSSRSSIATDPEHNNGEFDSQIMDTDTEAALEEKMLEDNEDMIIPDDMRRFLNERYGDGHSLYSYDPNALTESEIFYLQQGACGANNSNNNQTGNYNQTSQDGSVNVNSYSGNNSVQGMQMQNFYANSGMKNREMSNCNMNVNMENGQMNTSGHGSGSVPADPLYVQHQLSRENTAAWVQRQNSQNLPQPPGMLPPVTPTQDPATMCHGNMPPPKTKDRTMSGNMNWGMMNNNMQHINTSSHNMYPMMQSPMNSPLPPNMPVPHPPLTPKSGQSMNHPHPHMKTNQMHPNQGHMMMNPMFQGHMPHPPSTKIERGSPQVQVPHISQSQIPPRAKAANRNNMLQSPEQQQQQQHSLGPPNQNVLNMQGNYMYNQKMYPGYCGPMNMMPPNQYLNPHFNMNMPYGPVPNQEFNPNCQQSTQDHRSPFSKLEMSPGCNQVTSSTDVVAERQPETEAPPIENFMDNLNSISAENFMDNINSISQENMSNIYSPTAMSNRSNSQASRYNAALMNTSNMVVNDMSSTMLQLAEENKYFSRRQ